jgi:metal-dependent amidase/aminoacylase/carboxypeptidase family protein
MSLTTSELVNSRRPDLGPYEELYKYLHAHPELSFQEVKTAATIQSHLNELGFKHVHSGIGRTGVAAVYENGPGKTVLLRADMDALPVQEQTGLSYASTVRMLNSEGIEKPVMHVGYTK